jgi:hypothetical protein
LPKMGYHEDFTLPLSSMLRWSNISSRSSR